MSSSLNLFKIFIIINHYLKIKYCRVYKCQNNILLLKVIEKKTILILGSEINTPNWSIICKGDVKDNA